MMTSHPLRVFGWLLSVGACMVLAACGKTLGGYPGHVNQPSLVAPETRGRDDKTVYMDLIRQMQQQGAYYASLAHIDAYRQRYGDTPELRRLQADALRETQQWSTARDTYQGLVNTPQAAAAWHGLGLIAAHDQHMDLADQQLSKATQLEPVNAIYLSDLGYARLCAGRVAEAKEPLAMAAELAPDNAKVVANLALWTWLSGDPNRAEAMMQRASLNQATRDSVRQLAMQLRPRHTDTTGAPNTEPPARSASDVPAKMLDRLVNPSTAYKARP